MTAHDFSVLFVCTGNICRSPAAELVASQLLAGTDVRFSSAGTRGLTGAPVSPMMAALLQADSIPTEGFRARRLSDAALQGVNLVVGMDQSHRGAAAELRPALVRSSFTLLELVDIAGRMAAADEWTGDSPGRRLATLAREARRYRGTAPAAGIADPYGGPESGYLNAYQQIRQALVGLVALIRDR